MKTEKSKKWIIIFSSFFLLMYFIPLIFIIKEQEVRSPNGNWIAIQYASADEAHLVPYGNWVEIKPSYKFWHKPNSYASVFAGFCMPESLKLDWVNEKTLNISCSHGSCPIVRQLESWGDVYIQYSITSSELQCAT